MDRKMIVFDIDGTLFDNVNKKMWPSTIECLKKLKTNGNELVIASGRSLPMISNIDVIRPMINHYILINGMQIISNDKEIYKNTYKINEIEDLAKAFEENNILFGCVSTKADRMNKVDEEAVLAYKSFGLASPIVDKEFYKKEEIYQIWCFGDKEKIMNFSKTQPKYDFLSWGNYGFDVLKKGYSKGTTIKILSEKLGFKKEDIIAIGDGENDIKMIKEVGFGIAMGNGSEKLKEVADYITDDIDKDGLAKAFEYLKLI